MKTPHAILIGLSLIAAAIFFKDTMAPSAKAGFQDIQKVILCDPIETLNMPGELSTSCAQVKFG